MSVTSEIALEVLRAYNTIAAANRYANLGMSELEQLEEEHGKLTVDLIQQRLDERDLELADTQAMIEEMRA